MKKAFALLGLALLGVQGVAADSTRCAYKRLEAYRPSDARQFFCDLQFEVERRDVVRISQKISYPVPATFAGRRQYLKSAAELREHFDEVFNTEVKKAIASQDPDDTEMGWRGYMIGAGIVWFVDGIDGRVLIIAFNNGPEGVPDDTDPRDGTISCEPNCGH